MKILYTTTIGLTMIFFKSLIKELIDAGNTVDIACNDSEHKVDDFYDSLGCKIYHLDWNRSPLSVSNMKAIKQLELIIKENHYDIVHCHTPIAGVCARVACKKLRKTGLRVFYTAHGFHFYKGAPLINWLLYYPIEKMCSYWTDELITINTEDYELAKHKFKAKHIAYIPGVGIDVNRFSSAQIDFSAKRKEIGIPDSSYLLLSVGELNKNKNHKIVIQALAALQNPNVHYVIAGEGDLYDELINLSKQLRVSENVHLIGYRNDVLELYKISDAYILPSIREGLNVSIMEAMACNLPCIVGKIRGNTDLIDHNGGLLFSSNNLNECKDSIAMMIKQDKRILGEYNRKKVESFSKDVVLKKVMELYKANGR